MLKYIGKRLLYGLLVILGVVTLVFFLFNILPGDPARMMLGQRADAESVEMINRDLGRDKPVGVQFAGYLNDLSPISFHNNRDKNSYWYLDPEKYEPYGTIVKLGVTSVVAKMPYLRRSYQSKRKVTEIIATAFPQTAVLALTAMLFAVIVGILLGIVAALHKGSWIDRLTLLMSTLGMSLPSFFAAILIAWFFAYVLSDVTHLNMFGNLYTVDDYGCGEYIDLRNLILPALTLGIRPLAVLDARSVVTRLHKDCPRQRYVEEQTHIQARTAQCFESYCDIRIGLAGRFAGRSRLCRIRVRLERNGRGDCRRLGEVRLPCSDGRNPIYLHPAGADQHHRGHTLRHPRPTSTSQLTRIILLMHSDRTTFFVAKRDDGVYR